MTTHFPIVGIVGSEPAHRISGLARGAGARAPRRLASAAGAPLEPPPGLRQLAAGLAVAAC
eukprot:3874470-Pyramimonas_sp.AAC.1